MIKVLIVEDNVVARESLIECLADETDFQLCHAAESAEDGLLQLRKMKEGKPDILLLDIGLPGMSGIESIPAFRESHPDMDIVMFTTYDEEEKIFAALCAGASSYISKRTTLKVIVESLRIIHDGGSYMSPNIARIVAQHFHPKKKVSSTISPRKMDIIKGLVDGKSYQMIADDLNISIGTVRTHIKRIYKALQVNSSLEVVKKYNAGDLE